MGKRPFHRRTWRAARSVIVLATVFALVVAPLVVILTHGPAAHAVAASTAVDMVEEIAAQGHVHDKAGHEHQGGPLDGHNPADHDHQLHALLCQAGNAPKPRPDKAQCASGEALRNLTLKGPRRPPRAV